jgi:hypothetical protein
MVVDRNTGIPVVRLYRVLICVRAGACVLYESAKGLSWRTLLSYCVPGANCQV